MKDFILDLATSKNENGEREFSLKKFGKTILVGGGIVAAAAGGKWVIGKFFGKKNDEAEVPVDEPAAE